MKISTKTPGMTMGAHFAQGIFPALHSRSQRFPGGESLDDMALRAELVLETILLPHVIQEHKERQNRRVEKKEVGEEEGNEKMGRKIAVVSHGLFIGELVRAILNRDKVWTTRRGEQIDVKNLRGMKNTGWTRLEVTVHPGSKTEGFEVRSPPGRGDRLTSLSLTF